MRNIPAILRSSLIALMLLIVGIFAGTSVTFAQVPDSPALISPADGSNVVGTVIPFRWTQVTAATDYYLEVATDPGFTNLVFGTWIGNYIGVDLTGFPDDGQWYYWRVAAGNAEGSSPFSSVWSFVNGPSDIPDIPALISPANGANAAGTMVSFRWTQAARANDYYLQIATDSAFTNLVFDEWIGNYIGLNLGGFPDIGQTYYWRVAAGNVLGSSFFSSA